MILMTHVGREDPQTNGKTYGTNKRVEKLLTQTEEPISWLERSSRVNHSYSWIFKQMNMGWESIKRRHKTLEKWFLERLCVLR